jgi:two-component system, OmpR family, sensor histidine kinase VicK
MVSERTEVTHGEEKVTNVIPQFLSKAERVDSCADHKAASLAIGGESYKKLLLGLNRSIKIRYITEVTRRNIYYCKEMIKFAEEVHHIDRLKGNFSVSKAEYIATTAAQQVAGHQYRVIYSNVKEILEHHRKYN